MNDCVRSALAAALVVAAAFPGSAGAFPYSELIVFGDSLADSGNNAFVFDNVPIPGVPLGARSSVPPASPADIIPTFPYASNRYSNGQVWPEYLAASLGGGVSAQASLLGGTNYAYAGARTGPVGSTFPYSLSDQVASFLALPGPAPASALYIVQGGGNDARDALQVADPTALITAYVTNMATMVFDLQAAGARDIIVANVPDIGKTPAVLGAYGPALAAQASFLVMSMNNAMAAALPIFPTSNVRILDLFALTGEVVANPGDFGLADASSMCVVTPACLANPSGYFFWDGIHPTTAGHALLAQHALTLAVPEPETYALMLAGLGLLGFAARRNRRRALVQKNWGC